MKSATHLKAYVLILLMDMLLRKYEGIVSFLARLLLADYFPSLKNL